MGDSIFRLIFPFHLKVYLASYQLIQAIPENIVYTQTPQIQSGITAIDGAVNRVFPTLL